ncbi:MAG: response regulator [Lachnospiraceae bacterium]|nr:response regulator [Lachnospiraceae bacterium]
MHKIILLISHRGGYLLSSLRDLLAAKLDKYDVMMSTSQVSQISRTIAEREVAAIIIYCDDDITYDKKSLVYLNDTINDAGLPTFLFGEEDAIMKIRDALPDGLVRGEFKRPLNMPHVTDVIATYLKNNDGTIQKKILVIDDSGDMLRRIKEWLDTRYQIVMANSGMMGLKYLAKNKPDLILLDYEMPIISGKQVLEMIRSDPEVANIPVIFLTAHSDSTIVKQLVALKPAGYLLKSMSPDEIIEAVDDFFRKRAAKTNLT